MRIFCVLCCILALAQFVLPAAVFPLQGQLGDTLQAGLFHFSDAGAGETQPSRETVRVLQTAGGKVIETDTAEYLLGCLAAEMPADTPTEALKAQAVAAYTNVRRLQASPDGKAENADITDDPAKHQGYLDEAARRRKWGDSFAAVTEKFENAIHAVYGQMLTFEGKPITAAYFALSAGRTERAACVWGGELPYLQSVPSAGDRLSPDLQTETVLTPDEVRSRLDAISGVALPENPENWFSALRVSDSGSGVVESITVGGVSVRGQALRTALGLRSPAFTVSFADGSFHFLVSGNGHFVGMSQYGADYMARQGASYSEILAHYYPNTKLQ